MKIKWSYYIIAIFVIAILLRIFTLSSPFYSDENLWPYYAIDHSNHGFNFVIKGGPIDGYVWPSPPLSALSYRFFTWYIGVSEFTLRLLPFLIGLVNIFLTYLLAKKLFDKKVALIASFIMAISFWHIISSFLIEHDGSFLMLYWLLFFNSYFKFEETKNKKWLFISGLCGGLALLTKITGFLIFLVFAIYLLFKYKSIKKLFNIGITPLISSLVIFSIYPIVSFFTGYSKLLSASAQHGNVLTLMPDIFAIPRIIIYLALWATTLLSGIALTSFFIKESDKKIVSSKKFLYIWSLVVIIFYIFTKYLGAVDRYMSVAIPALCILSGYAISKFSEKKDMKKISIISISFFILLVILNFLGGKWIAHDILDYIKMALTLNWNFLFQFNGGTGPTFITSFFPLGIGLLVTGITLILTLFFMIRKNQYAKSIFIIFFAVSLAFNLFLVQAFILKYPYPDIGKNTYEAIDFVNNKNYSSIYSPNINVAWYLNKDKSFTLLDNTTSPIRKDSLVIIDNYPKRRDNDFVWDYVKNCEIIKSIGKDKIRTYLIYKC